MTGRLVAPLAALAVVIDLSALAAPAHAAFPGANGKIAFARNFQESTFTRKIQLWSVNPDGSGQTVINDTNGYDWTPAWSPDGRKIAFARVLDPSISSDFEIYVMNADGTGATRLTNHPGPQADDVNPAWSPDGKKIAFETVTEVSRVVNREIFVMNADGTGQVNLTNDPAAEDVEPAWSPDGQKIAFRKLSSGPSGIYVMNPDGTGQTNLTSGGNDADPSWSPDGRKIAFSSPTGIKAMNADGTAVTLIIPGAVDAGAVDPAWSPDGQKIAFVRGGPRCGVGCFPAEIAVAGIDGSGETQLTNTGPSMPNRGPDWQPINPAPYPRPVGASPMHISLVPAFTPCDSASANAGHEAPLSGQSCAPPVPRSSLVAVGPRSLGFARMIVLGNGECAPFDSTHCDPDVTIRFNITDVRSGSPTGTDYDTPSAQDLTGIATLPGTAQGSTAQITDQNNQSIGDPTGPYDKSATVMPIKFPVPIDCVPVLNPIDGSVCNAQTTANTLVPGSAAAGKRAIWELGQLQVRDQGPNGTPGDSDDNVFEVQGAFVP